MVIKFCVSYRISLFWKTMQQQQQKDKGKRDKTLFAVLIRAVLFF